MNTWQIDTAHTNVSFTAKHMMITKVRGIFKGVTGTIDFDEANPTASSVSVVIPAATIETGMEPRDNHLRSADFLDAETFPTLTFTSTSASSPRWTVGVTPASRPPPGSSAPTGASPGTSVSKPVAGSSPTT